MIVYILVQVVLCAVYGAGRLGLSYYHVDSAHLYLMTDIAETEDFALLKRGMWACCLHAFACLCVCLFIFLHSLPPSVLIQVEPVVVIVSSKVDKGMLAILKEYGEYTVICIIVCE